MSVASVPAKDADIRVQAASWLAQEKSAGGPGADPAALNAWLDADPRNRVAYIRMRGLWSEADGFAAAPAVRATRAGMRRIRVNRLRPIALAASIALAALAGLTWMTQPGTVQTEVGEQRTVRLDDGTEVVLDTDTSFRVEFTAAARHIELDRGRALFRVAKNAQRPFTVAAAGSTVTALGTEFSVRRDADALTVVLLEGSVRVAHDNAPGAAQPQTAVLTPDQQVRVVAAGISPPRPARREEDVAWQNGRMVFNNQPLEDVVGESNRYAKRKLRIGDARLQAIRISGVFRTGETEALVQALSRSYGLRAAPGEHGETVLFSTESLPGK